MSKEARDKVAELIEEKYGKLIMKIAYAYVFDYGKAEDVKQDVIYKCMLKSEMLAKFNEKQLYSYLATAARHTALNTKEKMINDENKEIRYAEEFQGPLAVNFVEFKAFEEKYGFSPESVKVLKSLPEIERSIILLKCYFGMSNAQVAEEMNMTVDAVKKRFQRIKLSVMLSLVALKGEDSDE